MIVKMNYAYQARTQGEEGGAEPIRSSKFFLRISKEKINVK